MPVRRAELESCNGQGLGDIRVVKIIAGQWKGLRIKTTEGKGYRPATGRVREALFSMLESRGVDWAYFAVLDVFAGSGSLGWEALSRGAHTVWFLENDAKAVRLLREHARGLAMPGRTIHVSAGDALRLLAKPAPAAFDLLFFDPPYGRDLLIPAMRRAEMHGWMTDQSLICAEVEAGWDWTVHDLPGFDLLTNRLYGQTRILLWKRISAKSASPSTREPSTP